MAGYKGQLASATVFFGGYLWLVVYVFALNAAYRQLSALEQTGYPLLLFLPALLFALWSDVATDSKGQTVFYSIFFVADLFLIVTGQFRAAAYLGLIALLLVLSRHRGWTHNLVGDVAHSVAPAPSALPARVGASARRVAVLRGGRGRLSESLSGGLGDLAGGSTRSFWRSFR